MEEHTEEAVDNGCCDYILLVVGGTLLPKEAHEHYSLWMKLFSLTGFGNSLATQCSAQQLGTER